MDSITLSKITTIWEELCEHLTQHYEILFAANLLDYDYRMDALYRELSKFKGYQFKKNQRIIISFYDTEYYLSDTKIGFTIENLMRILDDLDISKPFCQIFTNHHGLTKNIISRYGDVNIIENNYCSFLSKKNPVVLSRDVNDIIYHFCFMSHVRRSHRSFIRLWLELNSRKDKTIMSWHSYSGTFLEEENYAKDSDDLKNNLGSCFFVETYPFSRSQDKFVTNDFLNEIYKQNFLVLDVDYKHPLITTAAEPAMNYLHPWISNIFLNIVTETVFAYPYPYLTEKTFKCFWHLSPFIIVGAQDSLAYLKSLGFKTFSKWINEDYDNVDDPADRLVMIMKELDIISNWSTNYCKEVYNDMLSTVLEHNLHHYQNYYCKTLLNQTKKEILNV